VKTGAAPPPPDPFEPFKTAQAVVKWGVDYIVLTSVDRDDIADGGAGHFAFTVELIKRNKPELLVECLVSDFQGDLEAVERLATSGLDVYAHNLETVRRLQPFVRDRRAGYDQSLTCLQHAKACNNRLFTKTSLMLGLGETHDEVIQTMKVSYPTLLHFPLLRLSYFSIHRIYAASTLTSSPSDNTSDPPNTTSASLNTSRLNNSTISKKSEKKWAFSTLPLVRLSGPVTKPVNFIWRI